MPLKRRTLKPRQSANTAIAARPKPGLKRTGSDSTIENHDIGASTKRWKGEEKKAVTIIVNAKKAAVEAARRRWTARHRRLFETLLPQSSNLLDHIEQEMKESSDKGAYVPLHQLDEQPKLVTGGNLKDYQLQGLSFLVWMYRNGMNCILGDEMGLGKTLQTLSLLAYVKENSVGTIDPHVIVCPLSVLSSWESYQAQSLIYHKECARWVPSFKVLRFHGPQSERTRIKNAVRAGDITFDICVTTYDSYVAEDGWFKSRRWTYCVLDEGHKIKNAGTDVASKLQGLGALYRLILTGTPIHNNLLELWSLLHWLYPNLFTAASERLFKDSFDLTRGLYNLPFLTAAQNLLSTIMIRRTKASVEISVPPREELTVFLPLTEAQRFWTYRLLTRMDAVDLQQIFESDIAGNVAGHAEGPLDQGRQEVLAHLQEQVRSSSTGNQNQWKRLMNLLMQLRQVCDHPYLLPDAEPDPFVIGEHLVAASSKMIVIDKLLADILPKGERVLIFSQWTGMLDLLEDFMELRSIPYARLDGSTSRPRRALDIKLFQQEKSPYQVFLISTKAGGLGINLTKASTVIMCDSDWNPQASRSDCQSPSHWADKDSKRSVEDQMLDRIRRKLFLSVKVMGSDNPSADESSALKSKELMDILRKGSSALTQNSNDMDLQTFLDAPVSKILDASRSCEDRKEAKVKHELAPEATEAKDDKLLAAAEEEEKALLGGVAQVQSRLFEGQYVPRTKPANNKEIAQEWNNLQKRARVDNIVTIDSMQFIAPQVSSEASPTSSTSETAAKKTRKHEWEDCHVLECFILNVTDSRQHSYAGLTSYAVPSTRVHRAGEVPQRLAVCSSGARRVRRLFVKIVYRVARWMLLVPPCLNSLCLDTERNRPRITFDATTANGDSKKM
ncbi:hypothetical protein GLOTRDRAFT_121142, partial [Gloeophyllum trabeum ATCC 11539]